MKRSQYIQFLSVHYQEVCRLAIAWEGAKLSSWDGGAPNPKAVLERLNLQLDLLQSEIKSASTANEELETIGVGA